MPEPTTPRSDVPARPSRAELRDRFIQAVCDAGHEVDMEAIEAIVTATQSAVLPAHARQVREEIAAEIEAACPDPDTAHAAGHCDYRHAAQIARREAR